MLSLYQTLYVTNIMTDYFPMEEKFIFEMESTMFAGESEECPVGFDLATSGRWCDDIDECSLASPCSDLCTNFVGGYSFGIEIL